MTITVEIKGFEELQAKTDQMIADLFGAPILNAMRDSTLLVQRGARQYSPVDTGRLRASILPEIRAGEGEVQGVVGSNVIYAPFMEFGTRAHFPPVAALEVWARRHGMDAFVVARSIARKGLAPRKYLTRAFEESQGAIIKRFEQAVNEVVDK